jgi:hypothetical protein
MRTQDELLALAEIVNSVYREASEQMTIDTYAKRLWLTHNEKALIRLKNVLALYFLFRQVTIKPEKRYDKFWASILNKNDTVLSFPHQMNILTWNYDIQFLLSLRPYLTSPNLNASFPYFLGEQLPKTFFIFPINGLAGCFYDSSGRFQIPSIFYEIRNQDGILTSKDLLDHFDLIKSQKSTLMFSWENNIDHQQAIDSAISKLGNTEILVIIGYSFPFFNREIDLKIFNGLRNLKKVYYQVKDANKEILVERFGFNNVRFNPSSINAIQTKEISFYDQFHIPEEF